MKPHWGISIAAFVMMLILMYIGGYIIGSFDVR